MKTLLKKLSFFLIPFISYGIIVAIIDPFGYYDKTDGSHTNIKKQEISSQIHHHLWVKLQYDCCPQENIILGNSRAASIKVYKLHEITGKNYNNLAFRGGNLDDIIQAFWYANNRKPLKSAYIGIDFSIYNGLETNTRFRDACSISSNFFSYTFSRVTFSAVLGYLKSLIFRKSDIENPTMPEKDKYWNYKLDIESQRFFSKYSYPENYYDQLKEISEYCKLHEIKLVFFIPPSHVNWEEKIIQYGLFDEQERLKRDLKKLGPVYNFDITNSFTSDRKNFNDPVHIVSDTVLINDIWKQANTYSIFSL